MAADILELFEAFKEDVVRQNGLLVTIILTLWQASLLQFSLTKTATKARKIRAGFNNDCEDAEPHCIFCETELWALATSLMLQDVPFFAMRMTLIFKFNVLSYSNVFFTSKNTLVILLQFFRSGVIISEHYKSFRRDSTKTANTASELELGRTIQIFDNPAGFYSSPESSRQPLIGLLSSSASAQQFRGGYWVTDESGATSLPSTLNRNDPRIIRLAARSVSPKRRDSTLGSSPHFGGPPLARLSDDKL